MNILYANDQTGEYPDSYYLASAKPLENFPSLAGDISCDVCIIGAGYTGLSAALHLAQSGYDVVVLDAHRIGWGASGRNGGQLSSGLRAGQADLEKMLGPEKARDLWQLGQDANALVKSLIKKHHIDCDLKPGVLHANHKARFGDDSRREVDHLQSKYNYDKIRFVAKEEMAQMIASDAYHNGTLDQGAAHLHPLALVFGLARAAHSAGVRFFEKTRIDKIDKAALAKVSSSNGSVTAKFVILACNGYLGQLDKKTAKHVMPINNFIIATEPLSAQVADEIIRDDVAVADSKFVINYFRLSSDKRLLFGGGENYSYQFPRDIKSFVRKPMLEIYPQLADTKIDFGWGGTLAVTINRMPYFSKISTNILTAGGYSGEGLGMGIFAGFLMAQLVDGTASKFDLMASIPSPRFPGGKLAQKPLLAMAMLYYSLRDKF